MVSHPRKAVPGAVPGRKHKLPLSRLGEAYALAASGCSIEEIAEGLGVDRSTLLRRRHSAPEFCDAIERGRAEFERGWRLGRAVFARQLALKQAARTAEQVRQEAVRTRAAGLELEALLAEVPSQPGPKTPPAASQLPTTPDAAQRPERPPEPPATSAALSATEPSAGANGGESYALPLDEPF